MTKEELALEVIDRLKKEYPDAGCTLDYNQAWKLLVSVRLAAQCTDARVNVVVKGLFEKYPNVAALADAPVEECQPHYGGCVWKTGDCHGYALHPPGKPDRAGGRNQGPEARGNGTLEADSTGGRQRFLPPPGVSRA